MQFYVYHDGQQTGPFSTDRLRSFLFSGEVHATDLAWHEGAAVWAPLNSFTAVVGPGQMQAFSESPPPPVPGLQPSGSSGFAAASLVLGILSFFTFGLTSIPAVICGHISLWRIKRAAGRMSGHGLAVGGLVTGYFGVVILLPLFIAIGIAASAELKPSKEIKCLTQARQIGVACHRYAKDHKGDFPSTLDLLVPDYLPDKQIFDCPIREDQTPAGYDYFGGKDIDPPKNILFSSKATTRMHKRIFVTSDGSVTLRSRPETT